jgi:DNA-directed RNA polymerase specialized sigma24 family protein
LRLPRWRDRAASRSHAQIDCAARVVPLELPASEEGATAFDPPDRRPGPAEDAEANKQHERLVALLDQLPERQRDVLYNVYVEGMPVFVAVKEILTRSLFR